MSTRVRSQIKRYLLLCVGLIIMSFGVGFSIQAGLGTSPISSLPYVLSLIAPLSVGTATIAMHVTLIVSWVPCGSYPTQWVLCVVGILLIGVGVSMEVTANVVTLAGEGMVLAVCKVFPVKFASAKVGFDVTLVVIASMLSLLFLGHLAGVREGTVAAAIFVGLTAKQVNKPMKRFADKYLA